VIGGLHVDSKNAQVYWKAIFSDRTSPIQNSKVTVKLPKSLAGTINSYTYYSGSVPVSSQKLDEQTLEFIAQKPILPQQKLEVRVAFPNEILEKLKQEDKLKIYAEVDNWSGMSVAAFVEDLKLSLKHFRDFEKEVIVSDSKWLKNLSAITNSLFSSIEVKHFDLEDKGNAWNFVCS